jgi:hypothetical protein
MEDFVLLLSFSLHFFLNGLFGVLELAPDVVVGDVLIVVDVFTGSPGPDDEHG